MSVVDNCSLNVLVPESSGFDPTTFFGSPGQGQERQPSIDAIPRRKVLHFDEFISVYLILRTPQLEEPQLKEILERLTVSLEVIVFGSSLQSEHGGESHQQNPYPANRDILWSGQVDTSGQAFKVQEGGERGDAPPRMNLLWKVSAFLSRPRVRLQSPLVSFRPSGSAWRTNTSTLPLEDRLLSSGIPTSANLLESLKNEPGFKGVQPRLPALRLSRLNTTNSDLILSNRSLRITAQPTFRAMPAITARVRYSKASNKGGKNAIIASLDIETAAFVNTEISLQKVEMHLSEGMTKNLGQDLSPMLPMTCKPRDCTTFLFRLTPDENSLNDTNFASNSQSLDVSIDGIVLASDTCLPQIEMRWRTTVEFSSALNPSFGAPNQSLQWNKRQANITMSQAVSNEIGIPAPGQEGEEGNAPRKERATFGTGLGISITFTAPAEVYIGEPFNLDLFVVNRSSRPRKLAIVVVPKRKKAEINTHLSRISTSSTGGRKDSGVADAVTDENLLYAMQRNAIREGVQIISLSNDTVIGPLLPGSCFNADLKILPLATGYLQIEAIRIVDVSTNDTVDVRDLPGVMAQERAAKTETGVGD